VLSKEYEVEFRVDERLAAAVFIANMILP
jgi:hypothetical protein